MKLFLQRTVITVQDQGQDIYVHLDEIQILLCMCLCAAPDSITEADLMVRNVEGHCYINLPGATDPGRSEESSFTSTGSCQLL